MMSNIIFVFISILFRSCFNGISTLLLVWFFFRLGFWSGNLFLIAPFPDRCLLVPFKNLKVGHSKHNAICSVFLCIFCDRDHFILISESLIQIEAVLMSTHNVCFEQKLYKKNKK